MKILKDLSVLIGVAAAFLSGLVICASLQVDGISNEQKVVLIATLVLFNVCFAVVGSLSLGRLFTILNGVVFFLVFLGLMIGFWNESYGGWYYVLDPSGKFSGVIFSVVLTVAQGVLLLLSGILDKKKKR